MTRLRVLVLGQSLIEHDLRVHPYPALAEIRKLLSGADACFSDLECVLATGSGTPTREGVFLHAAPPAVLDCLGDLGVDLLSLANNHSSDLGPAGVLATIEAVRATGIAYGGTGPDEASATTAGYRRSPNGTIGLVAFASKVPDGAAATADKPGASVLRLSDGQPDPQDAARILGAITAARTSSDLVLAYHHDHCWEPDWHDTPAWKRAWARRCIDAGADLYVSHGVPLLHGIEVYRGRPIFYGLGSFIFHTRTPMGHYEPAVWESVIADCVFDDGRLERLQVRPIVLNERGDETAPLATRGRPAPADAGRARAIVERLAGLSAPHGTVIEASGIVTPATRDISGR